MNQIGAFLYRIGVTDIFGLLSLIGFGWFLIRRFILRKPPAPVGSKTVPRELLQSCVAILEKKERKSFGEYVIPDEIVRGLSVNVKDEEYLKKLLCSICGHLGINGDFIKLITEEVPVPERAGQINTDLARTTIRLEVKSYYTLDVVAAVLAHEAIHLHLYYEGIYLRDTWENEILTDTAAVYCGFGEYIYRGYAVMRGEFAFSYQKVGYIRQDDVKYIRWLMNHGE
ncbi:MAG: hypothetical protein K2P50_00225 [Lachnospiraceae bacterium]|nr:hypothetical protein [Lachnospiraceae bacterium]